MKEKKQIPLGTILVRARNDKGLTQVQVAQAVGIGENSLIRYEKAGIDEAGQFPPGPKLAALCVFLDIPPAQAMYACLGDDFDWKEHSLSWTDMFSGRPDFRFFLGEYQDLVNENRFLRSVIKVLADEQGEYEEDIQDWMYKQAVKLAGVDENLVKYGMVEKGLYDGDVEVWKIKFNE